MGEGFQSRKAIAAGKPLPHRSPNSFFQPPVSCLSAIRSASKEIWLKCRCEDTCAAASKFRRDGDASSHLQGETPMLSRAGVVLVALVAVAVWAGSAATAAEYRREEGPRGGEAVEGVGGRAAVRTPDGNVYTRTPAGDAYTDRQVARRLDVLPYSALPVTVGDQVYYQDGNTYYLPCPDDPTSYCVVPAPQ